MPSAKGPFHSVLIIAGLLLVAGNLRSAITAVGPVLLQIRADTGLSNAAASGLVSVPLLAFAVMSPVVPLVSRRAGLERSVVCGLLVLATGLLVRSLPGLTFLWAGTILAGVSIALMNVALPAIVKRDFPHSIGQITGAYSAVQSAFAALAAGLSVPISSASPLGWRLALGVWAGLALIACGVLGPQLRTGLTRPDASGKSGGSSSRGASAVTPWKSGVGWQVTLFMGFQSFGFFTFVTWLPSIEIDQGVPAAVAGAHLTILNVAGIFGTLLCSSLIPRLQDQRFIAIAAGVTFAVATIGLLRAPMLGALWATCIGLAAGVSIVLSLSFFGLRTRDHLQAASLSAMAQSVGYLMAATGPVVIGALRDASGSWTHSLIVLVGIFAFVALVGYLAGRARNLG